MPASQESLRITDIYRAQLLAVRARAVMISRRHWTVIDGARLDETFPAWLAVAAATLTAAQQIAAGMTAAYLAAYASSEGAAKKPPPPPLETVGQASDGRPVAEALAPALITVKVKIKQGAPIGEALSSGQFRAVRLVASEVMTAGRRSLDGALAARGDVIGWRRVTSPNPCGACLAAATGAIQHEALTLKVHAHCRCTKEPVLRGVRDSHHRPNGQQIFDAMTPSAQADLFKGRGGEEKARLIRSGDVPLEALIAPVSLATVPDGITEATLESLRAAR